MCTKALRGEEKEADNERRNERERVSERDHHSVATTQPTTCNSERGSASYVKQGSSVSPTIAPNPRSRLDTIFYLPAMLVCLARSSLSFKEEREDRRKHSAVLLV